MSLSAAPYQYLRSWLASDRAESPVLLVGDRQSLQNIIGQLAAATVCDQPGEQPCGACNACRLAVSGHHPDVILHRPTKTITIDQVRQLQSRLALAAVSRRRLVVIETAEMLSAPAASALLKSLEEPSARVRWLLCTAYPRRLLPTITSRCYGLRLPTELPTIADYTSHQLQTRLADVLRHTDQARAAVTDQDMATIAEILPAWLARFGPSPALYRSYLRWRDYYKIQSVRGNTKLAGDVLLAALRQLSHTTY